MLRKIAHYWYSDGHEIVVVVGDRKIYLVDPQTDLHPFSVATGTRDPHPDYGTENLDYDYATLGLYYEYEMRGTGWSGDC
jgi:hypothetical protein